MEWISTKDRLPEDDSDVFAAVWWVNSDNPDSSRYGIHDCLYYEGGEGSGQKIFSDCEGEEFEHTGVAYWMYKRDLAATVPRPLRPLTEGSAGQECARIRLERLEAWGGVGPHSSPSDAS